MEALNIFFTQLSGIVWGPIMLILLVGTGVLLTFRLGFIQITHLPYALKLAFSKPKEKENNPKEEGDISHFQALMTALAATIGTGNIAGVATAVAAGGPGAVFWMWVTAFFGMATKYAEGMLAVKYRIIDDNGEMAGGPMYYIEKGLNAKWLGVLFAFFGGFAAFGIGNMVQANSVAESINVTFGVNPVITGIILSILTAIVILGGVKSIGKVTGLIVPIMAIFYIAGAALILIINASQVPHAFSLIFKHAFTPVAATGGFMGAAVKLAIQKGVSRGVFSNESGLGSAPIAAAAAKSDVPGRQALVSMTGTFIDTIIVCTMTGLVLISTGAWTSGETGVSLTTKAFSTGLPGNSGGLIVSIGIIFFAYSTILGWSYYGEKCMQYLFGSKVIKPYRYAWIIFVLIGSSIKLDLVWNIADVFNALMAFPNLIGLIGLSGVLVSETRKFNKLLAEEKRQNL
ncbi:alanine or glycine:cation symporter, AGCS family [Tepidibacter formicigenes DSM 15518]|uniref:Alanine or glycine:cation symporter, AGCS family n=1 Tax=Tepidibacter formicigenes DSM 15518 TaxID=1123349 RepID=A0A1M6JX75_9FIRM|nr:sodium:alanine symporter family protein [Tepidibacter formicigenes]SHJ51280.1 alanine or glycine:cation symporter, AGCS family [Tepidibacter formicigenes DSM 15518]